MAEDKRWWDEIEGMMNRAVDAVQEAWDSSEEGRQRAMAAVNDLVDELKGVASEATSAARRSWSEAEESAADTEPASSVSPAEAARIRDEATGEDGPREG